MKSFVLGVAAGCCASMIASGQSLPLLLGDQAQFRILPSFHIRAEPSSAAIPDLGSSVALHRSADGSVVARRIVRDAEGDVNFGYQVVFEPAGQPDSFLTSFRSLDPANFGPDLAQPGSRRPAAFPPQHVIHLGDSVEIPLGVAAGSSATLIDEIIVDKTPRRAEESPLHGWVALAMSRLLLTMELRRRGIEPAPLANQEASPPPSLAITGMPHQFAAADAEFKTQLFFRLSVNGDPEVDLRSAHGRLIWFSLPGRGRYILSLTPRPELGFAKAGEARGGYLSLQIDGDSFVLTSGASIASESVPCVVYALHDPEWEPTASSQRGKPWAGSVGPEEIASLRKERAK